MFRLPLLFISILCFVSCSKSDKQGTRDDLQNLPEDTGGVHESYLLGSTASHFGYYFYTPGNYDSTTASYPLLIFLHGAGEIGNSASNSAELGKVLRHGPPKLIEMGSWKPSYPMLVASPQSAEFSWNIEEIHVFIEYMMSLYRVDAKRIYLTGLSMGGFGAFDYVGIHGDNGHVAAIVPICGGGNANTGPSFRNIPVWAFHGEDDQVVDPFNSVNMIRAINEASAGTTAKLTMYPGVGHDSWTRTYDGSGMGSESTEYDPFDMSVYDWFFTIEKK